MKLNLFSKLIVLTASLAGIWAARGLLQAIWRWFNDREAVTASMDQLGFSLAGLHDLTLAELARQTWRNALGVFGFEGRIEEEVVGGGPGT